MLWEQGVGGSNRLIPTIYFLEDGTSGVARMVDNAGIPQSRQAIVDRMMHTSA